MSEIKQINTGVAELLAVKITKECSKHHIGINKNGTRLFLWDGKGFALQLPPGNWTPLGIDTELTEEQCREVMGSDREPFRKLKFYNPSLPEYGFSTAKEAFASLMQANGVYSENPVMPPDDLHSYDQDKSWIKEYEEAEANTGTWLILKRLS